MGPEVRIQIWDREEVARWADRLDRLARASGLPVGFARWAAELARSFRSAGAALEFVDEDDPDAVFDVLTRLDVLRKDADHLLTRLGSTHDEDVTVVRAPASTDDAVTRVMAVPPRPFT